MIWKEINFGKHKGRTLPQVALMDPDIFFWMFENANALRRDPQLWKQAQLVAHRARHISPPDHFPKRGTAVEYSEHPKGGFCGMSFVPASGKRFPSSSRSFVLPLIDLHVPRNMKSYDKLGSKLLVAQMLRSLGYGRPRLTKHFCGGFFEAEENFAPVENAVEA